MTAAVDPAHEGDLEATREGDGIALAALPPQAETAETAERHGEAQSIDQDVHRRNLFEEARQSGGSLRRNYAYGKERSPDPDGSAANLVSEYMSSIPPEARSPAWTKWNYITEAAMEEFKQMSLARKLILGVRAVEFYRTDSDDLSPARTVCLDSFSELVEYLSRDVCASFLVCSGYH
jgi:hypothetical protein